MPTDNVKKLNMKELQKRIQDFHSGDRWQSVPYNIKEIVDEFLCMESELARVRGGGECDNFKVPSIRYIAEYLHLRFIHPESKFNGTESKSFSRYALKSDLIRVAEAVIEMFRNPMGPQIAAPQSKGPQ